MKYPKSTAEKPKKRSNMNQRDTRSKEIVTTETKGRGRQNREKNQKYND